MFRSPRHSSSARFDKQPDDPQSSTPEEDSPIVKRVDYSEDGYYDESELWGPMFPEPEPMGRGLTYRRALGIALGLLAVVAAGTGAFVAAVLPRPIAPDVTMTESEQAVFRPDAVRAQQLDRSLNILVLGVDAPNARDLAANANAADRNLRSRSDTMLLLRFDPGDPSINVLSIPRDTQVDIPERDIYKVNDANAVGGPALAAEVVSSLVADVPIDRYIRLNTEGIVSLIDAVGGVSIDVPKPMHYEDRTQGLTIDLEPGPQRLDGEHAHQFMRFRQDELGDIGRVQRQQMVLRALSKQLLNPLTVTRLPRILGVIRQNIDTNLTWEELLSISHFALRSGEERLNMILLPGRFSQPGEYVASYWLSDPAETYRIAVNYFNVAPVQGSLDSRPPAEQRVAVQNASGLPNMGGNMAADLRQKGFLNVFVTRDATVTLGVTQILAQQGDRRAANEVQALLGLGEVRVQSTGDLNSDITVRVGQDWAEYWYPDAVPDATAESVPPEPSQPESSLPRLNQLTNSMLGRTAPGTDLADR